MENRTENGSKFPTSLAKRTSITKWPTNTSKNNGIRAKNREINSRRNERIGIENNGDRKNMVYTTYTCIEARLQYVLETRKRKRTTK